jgi:hypothetical protein
MRGRNAPEKSTGSSITNAIKGKFLVKIEIQLSGFYPC